MIPSQLPAVNFSRKDFTQFISIAFYHSFLVAVMNVYTMPVVQVIYTFIKVALILEQYWTESFVDNVFASKI
jgi:hypothetical protein